MAGAGSLRASYTIGKGKNEGYASYSGDVMDGLCGNSRKFTFIIIIIYSCTHSSAACRICTALLYSANSIHTPCGMYMRMGGTCACVLIAACDLYTIRLHVQSLPRLQLQRARRARVSERRQVRWCGNDFDIVSTFRTVSHAFPHQLHTALHTPRASLLLGARGA